MVNTEITIDFHFGNHIILFGTKSRISTVRILPAVISVALAVWRLHIVWCKGFASFSHVRVGMSGVEVVQRERVPPHDLGVGVFEDVQRVV
jgi:hypothetical protein